MADYETLHVCPVPYDANNVSNFGGDPVTQLNLKNVFLVLFTLFYGHGAPPPRRLLRGHGQTAAVWKAIPA